MSQTAAQSREVAEFLSGQIEQGDVYPQLYDELQKLVASPVITESEFPATFLKCLATSGIETNLKNCVYHLMRSKSVEKWIHEHTSGRLREPLAYVAKVQAQWEKRILKSLNSMCNELSQTFAKPRCQAQQQEFVTHWEDLSALELDLSLFRPVYSPKDFLEVLAQLHSPNQNPCCTSLSGQLSGRPFCLIQVPIKTADLSDLREKFQDLSLAEPHLGVPQVDNRGDQLEWERYQLGLKVLDKNHAPLAQEFLKRGCPHSLRGSVWAQVLGCDLTEKDIVTYEELREAVISTDIMLDKLIMKDIQLTAANDEHYFIFEDIVYKTILCFSRDCEVATMFSCGSSNPPKAILRGKQPSPENYVLYPPSGIIPYHGMSMFCAPFCYVYTDHVQLYFTFRAMYTRFWFRLNQVSSHPQSIIGLCALFENIMQRNEPELWRHLLSLDIQPTRVVFRWIMRGFSGYFPPTQLLYLWDIIIAYDSMEVLPLLAGAIVSFRKENLMRVVNLAGVEAVLGDLSSLNLVSLLQLALSKDN